MLEMETVEDAFAVCSSAIGAFPDDAAAPILLGKLMEKIELARAANTLKTAQPAPQPARAGPGTKFFCGERFLEELKKKDQLDLNQAKKGNEMMKLLSLMSPGVKEKMGMNTYAPPPPLHRELAEARVLPKDCDVDGCLSAMEHAVENIKALPLWFYSLTNEVESDRNYMHERWGGFMLANPETREWIVSPERKSGDVSFDLTTGCLHESHYKKMEYDFPIQQQFSNACNRPEEMPAGQTHVAVGFVDLGSLIWTKISGDTTVHQPTQWIGYEASAFSVTKTLVLSEMLRDGSSAEAILQVWFSSVWRAATLDAFLRALKAVIHGAARLSAEVIAFLSHWSMHTTVSAAAAYRGWLETQTDTPIFPANFKRIQDRVALSRYITTGDLLGPSTGGSVGSVVMFANPPNSGAMSLTPNFLHTVYFPLLAKEWLRPSVSDVVQAAVNLTLARIAHCSVLARKGKLVTRVHHKAVNMESPEVLREISALKPYFISWSNVPDYLHPKTFFDMARQSSAPVTTTDGTVHCFYSMNWIQQCFGAHVFDTRPAIRKELFNIGNTVYAHAIEHMGLTQLLEPLQFTNPINTTSLPLYHQHRLPYARAFFAHGSIKPAHWLALPEVSPLSRTDTTFFMVFSFDESIKFNQAGEEE